MKHWMMLFVLMSCTPSVAPHTDHGCVGACAQLAAIGCEESTPTEHGTTCVQWCDNYHEAGYMRPFAECVSRATDKSSVRACNLTCP